MASDLLLSLFASLGPDRLQSVLLGIVVLLAYRLEFTDTFPVHTQGFFCYDSAYAKPYPGPEAASRAPPALIYALVTAGPTFTVRWCGSPGGMPGSTDTQKAGGPGWGWGSAGPRSRRPHLSLVHRSCWGSWPAPSFLLRPPPVLSVGRAPSCLGPAAASAPHSGGWSVSWVRDAAWG